SRVSRTEDPASPPQATPPRDRSAHARASKPACRESPPREAAEPSPVRRGREAEQLANGVGDLIRLTRTCALTGSHGRVVQELLHQRPREELDALDDIVIDVTEVAQRALDLSLPDRLGLLAQLGEKRLDFQLPVPATESLDLLLDDGLDLGYLAEPCRQRLVEP